MVIWPILTMPLDRFDKDKAPLNDSDTSTGHVSLRRRLLSLMFAAFAVLVAINATLIWSYAKGASNRSYDLLLAGASLSILERVGTTTEGLGVDIPYSALEIVGLAKDDRVFYAVNSHRSGLLTGTDGLPRPDKYKPSSDPVFFDEIFSGELFRFVLQSRRIQTITGPVWVDVQIGQSRFARTAQARELFVSGVAGLAFLSIIGLIFVWLAIRRALRPLASIEKDLAWREPSDLSPLTLDPPREIISLIKAINEFMSRLSSARTQSETFIADVAHQTRTSLAALQGQLALAGDADGEIMLRKRLRLAERQAEKASRLTNQLLSHAMVTHRADHEPLKEIKLEPLIRALLSEMLRDTSLRQIELSFEVTGSDVNEGVIAGDPISLREALRNLIENAVRHGPPKNEIDVLLSCDDAHIEIKISDAGPGIPESEYEAVLKRFHSLDQKTAGSGLGLSIVNQVAISHNGQFILSKAARGGLSAMLRFPALMASLFLFFIAVPENAYAQTVLKVWSATDTKAMQPVIDGFEKANPTIEIEYREFLTVELHDTFLKDSTAADVVISSAMDLQFDLVNRGLAQPVYTAEPLPDWAVWRSELFGFTFEPAVFAYSTERYDVNELPSTHRDLATFLREKQTELKGRVGTYDVRQSGIGYLYATQDAAQGQEALRMTEALGRVDARVFCCTVVMLNAIAKGELDFAYNLLGSYALASAKADPRIGVMLFDDYNLVMARTAFISKDAKNLAAAKQFVNFLLSAEGQHLISIAPAMIPIIDGNVHFDNLNHGHSGKEEFSFLPIRLSAGLLTYLDRLKRQRFLDNWEGAFSLSPE